MVKIIAYIAAFTFMMITSCKPSEQRAQELLHKGTGLVRQGEHLEAIEIFTRAIELKPDFAQAYTFRGSAKFDLGNWEGAYDDYTKAIEIDPTYAEPYDYRGRIRLFWYDEEGACEDFRMAFVLGHPGMFERVRQCE